MSKTLQTRIQNKHDIKVNWDKATNFIPLAGEAIVYDDLNQIKIGDGQKYLSELPFLDGKVKTVNNIEPDENGNIQLTAEQVGATTVEYVDSLTKVYAQPNEPTNPKEGDIWIDTDEAVVSYAEGESF